MHSFRANPRYSLEMNHPFAISEMPRYGNLHWNSTKKVVSILNQALFSFASCILRNNKEKINQKRNPFSHWAELNCWDDAVCWSCRLVARSLVASPVANWMKTNQNLVEYYFNVTLFKCFSIIIYEKDISFLLLLFLLSTLSFAVCRCLFVSRSVGFRPHSGWLTGTFFRLTVYTAIVQSQSVTIQMKIE